MVAGVPFRYVQGHNPASGIWQGDDVSYRAAHQYLLDHYPKTGICEDCGQPDGRTEHALIHGREYSRNREDYRELCHRCHMRYDLAGQKRDPEAVAKGSASLRRTFAEQRSRGIVKKAPRGEASGRAKLTDALVAEILAKRMARRTSTSLAKEYGVSKKTILNIIHGKIWVHVPRPEGWES